jgi:hypothetical protein
MLARLSAFICESPDAVHAMDLNPLLVGPQGKGVVAVDALVVTVAPSS